MGQLFSFGSRPSAPDPAFTKEETATPLPPESPDLVNVISLPECDPEINASPPEVALGLDDAETFLAPSIYHTLESQPKKKAKGKRARVRAKAKERKRAAVTDDEIRESCAKRIKVAQV